LFVQLLGAVGSIRLLACGWLFVVVFEAHDTGMKLGYRYYERFSRRVRHDNNTEVSGYDYALSVTW
jgi:hypothetical protein